MPREAHGHTLIYHKIHMNENILFKQSDQQMHIYVRGQEARSKYLHYNFVVNFCGDDNIGDVTSLLFDVNHP